ncbi:hypothetical protein ACFP1I_03770 [Dyadobacter subterraneus]|uniref:Outer membrane protein beta-barrel domain-containing protein n=1 Tax=Dyadobacter subterraneus TaxID=2773304 RepID=A0ABR9W552_9BACT|nr:hypothetical protein [Dyadobacter subterraneus]MBE9460284.1 hypothetical protein [Dyadobacter subterraneus]
MKFYSFITAMILSFLILNSQESKAQDTKNFFSVTGGYSLPVGQLAREKLNDPLAGLAGSGHYGQVNYDHRIWRWFGLRLSGSLNVNKTNSDPIIEKANSYVQAIGRNYTWQSDVSEWKMGAALFGPAIYLNMNRVQIEAHVQGGIVRASTPSVYLKGQGLTADGNIDPTATKVDVSLNHTIVKPIGFGAGASIRLPLFKALFFQVSGDVIGAKAEVKDLAIVANVGGNPYSDRLNEKRFIGVVNVGAGLGLAF